MAIDQGGLNYTIRVNDEFTENIRKFRREVLLAQETLRGVQQQTAGFRDLSRSLADAGRQFRSLGTAGRQQGQAVQGLTEDQTAHLKVIQATAKAQEQAARTAQRINRTAQRDQAAEITRVQRAAVAQQRAADQAARSQQAAADRAARAQRKATASLLETDSAANRLLFTFRRLFGVLAVFTLARQGIAGFGALVRGAVGFNQQLEDSRLSLAALFTSVGQVTDSQGKLLSGSEAFTASIGEARRQTDLLRRDALLTTGTFEQLLEAFQTAIGPGLKAGFNLDQVRTLTVQISQAATALGVSQDQLAEEIRSLFSAQGSARTTRLLALFGPGELKQFQSRGPQQFFDALTGRLSAFGTAANLAQRTLTGLLQRLRESVSIASGAASEGFFDTIKTLVSGLGDLFVTVERDASGVVKAITPNPQVVGLLRQLFDFLGGIVNRLVGGIRNVDLNKLAADAQDVFRVVGAALAVVANGALGFFQALRDVVGVLSQISGAITALAPLVTLFVRLSILSGLIKGTMGKVAGIFNLFATPIAAAGAELTKVQVAMVRTQQFAVALALALGGSALAAQPILSSIFEVNLTLEQTIRLIELGFVQGLDNIIFRFKSLLSISRELFGTFNSELRDEKGFLKSLADDATNFAQAASIGFLDFLGASDKELEFARNELRDRLLADDKILENRGIDRVNREAAERAALEADLQAKRESFEKKIGAILAEGSKGEGFQQRTREVQELLDKIKQADQQAKGVTVGPRPTDITPEQQLALRQQQQKTAAAEAELNAQRGINDAIEQRLPANQRALVEEAGKLNVLEQQLLGLRDINRIELELAQRELNTVQGQQAKIFVQEKINALKAEQVQKEGEIEERIRAQKKALEEARLVAEGSLTEGFSRGLRNFSEEFSSRFNAGIAIATSTVQSFSQFVAQSVVDAFDPTKDTTIQERFARFLQGIAQQVIATLTQLAIARAIALGFSGGGLVGGGVTGLAKGGPVQAFATGGHVAPQHYGVEAPPPKGVPASDTVPAWLTPGEFVHTVAAVRKYGMDVMAAINTGAIDPTLLRGLMGARTYSVNKTRTLGHAAGGLIGAGQQAKKQAEGASQAVTGGPSPAFIVPSDQAADRFLNGGVGGVARFMKTHRGVMRSALGLDQPR